MRIMKKEMELDGIHSLLMVHDVPQWRIVEFINET